MHLREELKQLDNQRLSGKQMVDALKGKVKVVVYSDVVKMNSLDELLNPHGKVIILYQTTSETSGHWCCLFRQTFENVIFFDPYGLKPDDEIPDCKYLSYLNGETPLRTLLNNSNYNVSFNPNRYEKWSKDMNSCGRHVIFRLQNSHMTNSKYHQYITKMTKSTRLNPDELVAVLTKDI